MALAFEREESPVPQGGEHHFVDLPRVRDMCAGPGAICPREAVLRDGESAES